jgi:hypothetical protein
MSYSISHVDMAYLEERMPFTHEIGQICQTSLKQKMLF